MIKLTMGKLDLGIMFRKKHDLTVSSRSSEFNVDISVVNVHCHFSKMFRLDCKFNLSLLLIIFHDFIILNFFILKNNWGIFKHEFFGIKTIVDLISV